MFRLAPALNSNLAIESNPLSAATCNGILPLYIKMFSFSIPAVKFNTCIAIVHTICYIIAKNKAAMWHFTTAHSNY